MRASNGVSEPLAASVDKAPATTALMKDDLGLEQARQRIGGRELGAVQECQPFLGAKCQRLEAGLGKGPGGRHAAPSDQDLARPDHRGGHVRQRGQVARCTHRALGRHDRDQVLLEHRLEHGDRFRPDARSALGQARELERHHQPHDRRRRRLAHAGRMRQHDVALQGLEVVRRDPDARQLAEARC